MNEGESFRRRILLLLFEYADSVTMATVIEFFVF
jgi:hypothetical protein